MNRITQKELNKIYDECIFENICASEKNKRMVVTTNLKNNIISYAVIVYGKEDIRKDFNDFDSAADYFLSI